MLLWEDGHVKKVEITIWVLGFTVYFTFGLKDWEAGSLQCSLTSG